MKVRFLVAYKGTDFHGFAEQSGQVATVAQTLRLAIEKSTQQSITLTCAGRTDSGVHAHGQVVSFDVESLKFDLNALQRSVNRQVGPAIVVRSAQVVDDDFNARFSAIGRSYRYNVLNSPQADPLRTDFMWWVPESLDLAAMNEAASAIVGEHDFSSFCRRPDPEVSLTRSVSRAEWVLTGIDEYRFYVEANAFCHQMVRSLVGQLVEIGRGRRPSSYMAEVLASRSRDKAATLAPPQGLVLWEVRY